MAIFVSKKGEMAIAVQPVRFDKEDQLQEYIWACPATIQEIGLTAKPPFILHDEVGTGSGGIDAFGIDEFGSVYIIETKLERNSDKRRVAAQLIDYAASLWKHTPNFDEFLKKIGNAVREKWDVSLNEKLKSHFGIMDDALAKLLKAVQNNIQNGRFRFVIAMDRVENRLRDMVDLINKGAGLKVFCLEFQRFIHKVGEVEYEIMVPRLYGADNDLREGESTGQNVGEAEFLDAIPDSGKPAIVRIYECLKEAGTRRRWGKAGVPKRLVYYETRDTNWIFTINSEGVLGLNCNAMEADEFTRFKATSDLTWLKKEDWVDLPFDKWQTSVDGLAKAICAFNREMLGGPTH